MKKIAFSVFALGAALLLASFSFKPSRYEVDAAGSKLVWTGTKVTGSHTGHITLQSGALEFDGDRLKGGEFTIDMASMTCTDLTGEWADKLVGHLKSDDFFGVANHATSVLRIKKVTPAEGGKYKVKADLTIKGTTKPVEFEAEASVKDGQAMAKASISVNRTEYGIRYGSGSFFDNLGDKAISDEFTLEVELQAKAAQ
jgi:polyisoprenoid-binding protein YceI